MMDGWNMNGWGWMSLIMVFGLVVVALLARTWTRDSRSGRTEEKPALEVLARRFAAGEIDEDEFNRKRAALSQRV